MTASEAPRATIDERPLAGIKVIDLSRQAPGPYCSMLLADFGAEVVMVEPPGGSTRAQATSPEWELESDERVAGYAALRRNKRSIELDLKAERDRQVLRSLIAGGDVLLEGFRPGALKRLGFDYESCKELNPRLIYCSITGYGQTGALATTAGHDINFLAYSGLLSCLAGATGRPAIPLNLVADFAGGGLMAALGIMLALFHRQRTGAGQAIDVSMLDGVYSLLAHTASMFFARAMDVRQDRYFLAGGLPHYATYGCRDGRRIALGGLEPWFFEALMDATGRPDLRQADSDPHRHEEVARHLEAWFGQRSGDEAMELLGPLDACIAPVLSFTEAMELAASRGMAGPVDGYPQIGVTPRLSVSPGRAAGRPPRRNADGGEIRRELGLS
ncbi:CoA transferase [bacterium]|nr:MAG: CoA transferase [bacterium]